ncbi:hypothetical protein H0H92_009610 [Tricholoma furcatifolium]|nr:hypothetical protein H0H92_009610 [Tricholoma furcatifolium]
MASQIAECLAATLSPDQNTRTAAELKLAEYFASPGWERWSPYFSTFKGGAPSVEIKGQIRQNVFHSLSDRDRKIRSLSAHTLSSIAKCDWPDEYPELLSSLLNLLSSGSPDSVHGAMQVLTEFVKSDLTEDQLLPVLRQLLPVLLTILGSTETHSALTRARTISVFRQCVECLFMVKDQHPQATKEAVSTILPVWLEAFKVLLKIDPKLDVTNTVNWDGLAIRIQVFKTLDTVYVSFPRTLTPYLHEFLSYTLVHLQVLYPTFQECYLSATETAPGSSEDEAIELPQLICPIMDFAAAVTRGGKSKDWFTTENLNSLVSAVFDFVQMTDEDEETWANNANAFVAQEEDETQSYSVRVAGFDFLGSLIDMAPAEIARAFQLVVQKTVQFSQQQRDAGSQDWWRPLEATLAAVGSQSEAILDCIEDEEDSGRPKPIDIEFLLSNVIPSILGLSQQPFLQGRGFVFASKYAKLLSVEFAGQYLDAALQVIEASEAGIPVKISAVKAAHNFFQEGADSTLVGIAPRVANILGPFLFVASDDTLSLVLETLLVVLEVDKGSWLKPEMADSLVLALLEVLNKNIKGRFNPIFVALLMEILTTLAASPAPGVYEAVVKQALPRLNAAIASPKEESYISASAIDLVASLVRGSPERGLGEGFFALIAPNLFTCLGEAEDRDNGISCLTLIIRKDCAQLIVWHDDAGRGGLEYTLTFIAKTLESQDESGGLVIGDLIIHLFRRVGEAILPVLPQLLQAMVGRMASAKTATFLQASSSFSSIFHSLVIPFAFLITNQRDAVVSLLEGIQGDRTGLDILIQTWCENAETFQGFWPARISTLGLIQLFVSEHPSLRSLIVKGDIIVNKANQDAPTEFTRIPFPLKALKLLLHDVQSGGDSATISAASGLGQSTGTGQGETWDVDSDDGDEAWEDKDDDVAYLSELLGPRGMAFDDDEVLGADDDEDLKNDPVSEMDMQAHLVSFFKECAAHNTSDFSTLVSQLSVEETLVLRQIIGA